MMRGLHGKGLVVLFVVKLRISLDERFDGYVLVCMCMFVFAM